MFLSSLEKRYLEKVEKDIYNDIFAFVSDVENLDNILKEKKLLNPSKKHTDRAFEWTTHPSQTWDTFAKQLRKEVKNNFFKEYIKDKSNNFLIRSKNNWLNDYAKKYSLDQSVKIIEKCNDRLFSLSNAKIPAHSGMTEELLKKVPLFFKDFDKYKDLSPWEQEEKAEEKNISFLAFLEEEKISQVYIDERWEAIQTAKKMFRIGDGKYYLWIDFDGAKRPDGIMISIFAQMLIEEINDLGKGISEQQCIESTSLFTLSEREYNRKIVKNFKKIDTAIYALTRQMASDKKYSQNPVCIAQMENFKNKREYYLRKIMKIRNKVISYLKSKKELENIFSLSENIHFIPRFDPFFVVVLKKSNLGKNLNNLSIIELQAYNTVSHIIDQIILINSLSPDRVCQIILAQTNKAEDLISIDNFLKEKTNRWRENNSQYFSLNPLKELSLCPLFESEYTANPEHVKEFLLDLWDHYEEKIFFKKFPEMFFAGSDLSKSIGSSCSYLKTWESAIYVNEFNKKYNTKIFVKLGSGESYFRQNGFLDPKYKESIWKKNLSKEEKYKINKSLGEKNFEYKKPSSGLLSLLKKSPWLNSVTLQSKAREWIFEMPPSILHDQLNQIYKQKEKNITKKFQMPSKSLKFFCDIEKKAYQSFIGNENNEGKNLDSYASLIELFATELTPVLRDRSLKRSGNSKNILNTKNNLTSQGKEVLEKLQKTSGINSRAIAANTTSTFLFPLGLLGKGSAFEEITKKYPKDEVKKIISFWEIEELLQVIRQFYVISNDVFKIFNNFKLGNLNNKLYEEWEKIQKITPLLIEIIEEKIFSKALQPKDKMEIIPLLSERFRSLLDYSILEKKWNFESENLIFLRENFKENAKSIIEKGIQFLKKESLEYPFKKKDILTWDLFMTMQCRMRGSTALLG
jgi:hypothetical protein